MRRGHPAIVPYSALLRDDDPEHEVQQNLRTWKQAEKRKINRTADGDHPYRFASAAQNAGDHATPAGPDQSIHTSP